MPDAVAPEFIALQRALAGHYSLERELGRGGMGIVFLARDVALDRPVAIKLLPPDMAAQPALRERFVREARTAAKLSQPNIVPIHAVEERDGLVYFVMSYVDGETLGERLRTKGPLTPSETARMLQEIAWALGYAHGRGVVHRDVKPDNIMLERGTGRAVVMDFGIAAAGDAGAGEVIGTAQYVSPEQANGDAVDGRCDLYSLGVVGFLALSGRLPFEADDTAGLLAMHITRPAPPLASVTAGVPSRLARAVDRCLQKNRADRFPTGEALAEAIAQTVETRRELPVPVRIWLTKGHESHLAYLVWYFGAGWVPSVVLGNLLRSATGTSAAFTVGLVFYLAFPFVFHAGYRTWRLRRLLAAGYGLWDARLAVRDAAERKREELSYEFGAEPPAWARFVYRATLVLGIVSVASVLTIFLSAGRHGPPGGELLVGTAVVAGGASLLGYVVHRIRPGKAKTRDFAAELRLKFWSSRFARWLERVARIGLRRTSAPAELTYRPTELALGLAAGALFESLPRAQKRELKELPALIAQLERDAELMRKTVDELGSAVASLGADAVTARSHALRDPAAAPTQVTVAAARDRLRDDLAKQRDHAAQRLAAAVASLESIRLNLLRLKAGTGTVTELTADLSAAREVTERLRLEAAALEEVETMLRGARQSRTAAPPADGAVRA
jgi:predicted Ser/Thr protein kinase